MIENAPEAAVWLGLGLPTLGLLYKIIPQRGAQERGVLKDVDLERLAEHVKLFERVARVEYQQTAQGQLLQELKADIKSDMSLLFTKLDEVKDDVLRGRA
jgi:hypothetical protein